MEELIAKAREVINNAYAPYSSFKVAAVVKTKSGKVYTGVNIENASYGLTVCAERVAVFKAVSEGDRDIDTVVVYTDTDEPTPPCGACRQVIAEFNPNALIVMAGRKKTVTAKLSELLPNAFTKERLR
ncbi:MAG: cytidine deaminase [Pyrobaculum arsenaticum]|uniref:cytidine deaminase n=2 Tax=Pyrobaculum arsenaticum TaxID=121277 RepID=A4WGZ5_PYRAR|nr:cytidine deaminase [Pyrobaculum arsenaticum]ABP49662.1 cytidine deaminase [Pyrobaculum arsenaticum DSM 13514]MCY0891103.1 cytidine deaminase [Pyrobaculum arsenaticum]NYR15648.1 cytidine deaminase [Pyrobaculum arsenaticum]